MRLWRRCTHDYASFVERELKYRRWMHYPPFGVLANVLVQGAKLEEATGWAALLGSGSRRLTPEGVGCWGRHGADRADQGDVPVSFDFEGGVEESAECGAEEDGRLCGRGWRAAAEPGGGCGCAAADVRRQRS